MRISTVHLFFAAISPYCSPFSSLPVVIFRAAALVSESHEHVYLVSVQEMLLAELGGGGSVGCEPRGVLAAPGRLTQKPNERSSFGHCTNRLRT